MRTDPPVAPGYIDAATGRVALSLKEFHDLGADITGYWLNESAEELHLECWAMVEGLDPHVNGKGYDVWFANGQMIEVAIDSTRCIFVSGKEANKPLEALWATLPTGSLLLEPKALAFKFARMVLAARAA